MPRREVRAKMLGVAVDQLPDGRGKHGNQPKGKNSSRWNPARIRSSHGYTKVRVGRDHPLADPNGYAYEHLVVWVAAGRPHPRPDETLHHRNEDKADNRLGNLELLSRSAHARCHLLEHGRSADGRFAR